jgi:hypothetical protein
MNPTGEDRKHWSQVAEEWIAWARKPNHDAFWAYRGCVGRVHRQRPWTSVAARDVSRVSATE